MNSAMVRAGGAAVAAGGVVWGAVGLLAPPDGEAVSATDVWSSGVYLLGVIALVAVVGGTGAAGRGRWGRWLVAVELVLLGLAALSTLITLARGQYELSGVLLVLDMAWPLSQLGMIAVGITVVAARVWPARTSWLLLATALWLPVGFVAPEAVTSVYLVVVPLLLGLSVALDVPARAGRSAP
ncbi:hypothetical protein, partial [Pseudonocardia lacus]|uniref:hypothetical protein n=1 Tax=Pseudonocardia lacus TaxID=2835865 RepID=UPI001BDC13EE